MSMNVVKKLVLVVGSALLIQSVGALAADSSMAPPPPPSKSSPAADNPSMEKALSTYWMDKTHHMLDDLKGKLNLQPGQQPAWDTWSRSILDNSHAQVEKMAHWHKEHMKLGGVEDADRAHLTTPQRMNKGLDHLRIEIKRMQDHVAQLEKAQASTQQFYDSLDTNQKTIFDLYWQKTYESGWRSHMMGDGHCGGM